MRIFVPLEKHDEEKRLAIGYASTPALDSQGEIVKREAVEAALPDYMRFANVREMHQPSAVGVAQEADVDANGLRIAAKVVDDDAWEKVKQRVYKGFSIGGRVTRRAIPTIVVSSRGWSSPRSAWSTGRPIPKPSSTSTSAISPRPAAATAPPISSASSASTTRLSSSAPAAPTRRPRRSPMPTIRRKPRAAILRNMPASPSASTRWRAKSRRNARS